MSLDLKQAKHITWGGESKGKAVPLEAWTGPEGSRKLSFPDYVKMAEDGCKVVSLRHRPLLSRGK